MERVLGRGHKVSSSGLRREVKECCYDIPLLESLQALLKNEVACDQVRVSLIRTLTYPNRHTLMIFLLHIEWNQRAGENVCGFTN